MSEHAREHVKLGDTNVEQGRRLEIEVAKRLRDFVDDPRLKFHFTTFSRMGGVLEKGVLSYELAKRAGVEVGGYLGARDGGAATNDRSVSVADREKNPGNEREDNWWIKQFLITDDHVGFLLPDDIKLREKTPWPGESLAPIRIRPEKFEGLFVKEREELYETIEARRNRVIEKYPESYPHSGAALLCRFFDFDLSKIEAQDEEIGKLEERISEIYAGNNLWGKTKKEWPDAVRETINALGREMADRAERVARAELEKIVGKPAGEITERDLLIHFAKNYQLPLYTVSGDFKSQKVIWPEIQVET